MSDIEKELEAVVFIRDTQLKNLLVSCIIAGVAVAFQKSKESPEEESEDEHLE